MKPRILFFIYLVLAFTLLVPGCKKNSHEQGTTILNMDELTVPPNFDWESSRLINLRVSVDLLPAMIGSLSTISVFDGDPLTTGRLLTTGDAGYESPYESQLRIPTTLRKIFIMAVDGAGNFKIDSADVTDEVKIIFSMLLKSSLESNANDPDCTPATKSNTLSGNQTYNITNGTSYYVTSDFSGTLNFGGNGGTITVCGIMHPLAINNMGTFCYIVVTHGGTFQYQGTLNMGNGSRIYAYSNSHVSLTGVTMSNARIWNTSTDFVINENFTPSGGFENYGYITINHSLNFTTALSTLVNTGSILVGETFNLSSVFYNNCKLIIHNETTLNSGMISMNGAYMKETSTIYVNPGVSLLLKNGSMISTLNYVQNTTIQGTGGANEIKISGSGSISGTNKVAGSIEMTTPTGTLAAGGSSNFINGAALRSIQHAMVVLPVTTCNPEGMGAGTPPDSDADGVPDNSDHYPNDPYRAYDSYYPASTVFGSIAFEDNWPSKGDYDMNDLVVDYRFQIVTNAQNKVVDIKQKFYVRAGGAKYNNGFGIRYDGLLPGQVTSVSGCSSKNTTISVASNGVENNQDKAVIVVFDNFRNVIHLPQGNTDVFYNTSPTSPKGYGDTLTVTIHLAAPVVLSSIGSPPFNPFLIVDMDREKEIHLADHVPTSLAGTSFFGTGSDNSNPAAGRYYKTNNNLPWALNLPSTFDYLYETVPVIQGYNHFATWAQSSGTQFPDWYSNSAGYRVSSNIFQ